MTDHLSFILVHAPKIGENHNAMMAKSAIFSEAQLTEYVAFGWQLKSISCVWGSSLLCTSRRKPIGRVDDIFGPVDGPLYLVQYCGKGAVLDNMKESDPAFSVAKYSTYLEAGSTVSAVMGCPEHGHAISQCLASQHVQPHCDWECLRMMN